VQQQVAARGRRQARRERGDVAPQVGVAALALAAECDEPVAARLGLRTNARA
jgi:hypothetical protein